MKRLLAALLALVLLTGCTPGGTIEPETSVNTGNVCYVPLDDRPDNWERVEYLANSLGYTLLMPEKDLFATKLDSQPLNENGTQYGDRAALYEWVLEQEKGGCDRYVLFIDQLTSGGLVNSRHMSESVPVTLSDGTVLTEAELLETLLTTLAADGNNVVWLLDTVMRLAPTVGYDGFGLAEYNALRAYGIAPRPALTGSGLTVENVVSAYPLAADGTVLDAASLGVTEAMAADYFAARERKLHLSAQVQETLARPGYEKFRLLTGIDDSSEAESIQKNEIAFLRQGLRTGDAVLSGVDDLAFKAVTRMYLDECAIKVSPAVTVEYFGGTEDQPACDYDYQPLDVIMEEHLAYFGMRRIEDTAAADMRILVLTQPADAAQKKTYCLSLSGTLLECEQRGTPVILIDAGNGAYETMLHDLLKKDVQLGSLFAYSGFLDMAIVTGTALSHGIARYAWLANGNGESWASNLAFCQSLTASVVLDMAYKHVVRLKIIDKAKDAGGDPNNFHAAPALRVDKLTADLSTGMRKAAEKLLENLAASRLPTSLDKDAPARYWGEITLENWSFPWDRAFEVRMDILVASPRAKLPWKPFGN